MAIGCRSNLLLLEEDVRFELTDPFGSSVFKTDAIGHSANLPLFKIIYRDGRSLPTRLR